MTNPELKPDLSIFTIHEQEATGDIIKTQKELLDLYNQLNWWHWDIQTWEKYLESLKDRSIEELNVGEKVLQMYGEEVLKLEDTHLKEENELIRVTWLNHYFYIVTNLSLAA